ncbi:hypothetical protein ACIGXA_33510 [Streptomyces fildesensis]|uniref:DUF4034 domain-containing protein n=1 Tax=Streptomyces fildesensis TaxID=375757 RepID=A0ABW8CH81_9ACTN
MAWIRRPQGRGAPLYDPAFGDQELTEACQDMIMGRWEGARDLLAAGSSTDWDRRAHRIRLLADAAATRRTVDIWQVSAPRDPDAAILLAETEVMRMFAAARSGTNPSRDSLDRTVRLCLLAAGLAPADPHPWVSLITLSRLYENGHPQTSRWWRELHFREPYHREGHHQALRHLSARWHGSHGEANNFAWDAAAGAPEGSPLAVLSQVAVAEQYRYRLEREGRTAAGLMYYWSDDGARWHLRRTMSRWIGARITTCAQDVADLNHLAHGLVHGGMLEEAAEVFQLLDNRATVVPWSFTDGDPEKDFVHWRDRVAT